MNGPVVYRLFASDGQLLYVGATSHFHRRMKEHRQKSVWWRWAARSTVTRYPSMAEALAAEAAAIRDEAPTFNLRGVPRNALAKAA